MITIQGIIYGISGFSFLLVNGSKEALNCIGKLSINKIFTSIVDYFFSVNNSQPDNTIQLIKKIEENMKTMKDNFNSFKDNLKDFNSFKDNLKNGENHNNINYHLQILLFVFIILFIIMFLTIILMLLFQNKKINNNKKELLKSCVNKRN